MDREVLQIFLRSGPARKFSVLDHHCRTGDGGGSVNLFETGFLNHSILFKCLNLDDNYRIERSKPICTLVFFPYDAKNPHEGGESFVFTPDNFNSYLDSKYRAENVEIERRRSDEAKLHVFDSIPTFSPLIVDLAFDRAGLDIPRRYLDLPPALKARLHDYLKGRIRPLIVAAFESKSRNLERALEEMTAKLISLDTLSDVLPLAEALRLPADQAVEILSSWIGLTYFEYEYSNIQNDLKDFIQWMATISSKKNVYGFNNQDYLERIKTVVRSQLKSDWERILDISRQHKTTYNKMVFNGAINEFSGFLINCKTVYWQMADILGRLEQTNIAWREFKRSALGVVPFNKLIDFLVVLKNINANPPQYNIRSLGDMARPPSTLEMLVGGLF